VHQHTLEIPDERTWASVIEGLREGGYLIEED
jgi:transcriptional regulator of NAD metabolism